MFKSKRVRYIQQLEMAECGAASLAMVLDYHGCATPLVDVRTACGVSRDGSSAAAIVRAARSYGLDATGLRLDPEDFGKLPLPAILHWEFNHFVVLEAVNKRHAVLVDPARGRYQVDWGHLSASYTGVVLGFEPTPRLAQRAHRSGSLTRYLTVLSRERGALVYTAAAALMLELLSVVSPAALQIAIDHIIKPARAVWLLPLALAVVVAGGVRRALEWLRDRVLVSLQTALDLTIVGDFVNHLFNLPLSFFEHRSTGDLMQRVEANGELRAISAQLVLSALDALMLLAYAALMLAYDAGLGALALVVSLSRVALFQRLRQSVRQGSANVASFAGRERSAIVEALAAPEMMRALGIEAMLSTRYSARMSERLNAEVAVKNTVNGLGASMSLFDGAATALILWLGGMRVIHGEMTIGVLAGFLTLQRLVDRPLAALFHCLDRYLYAQGILTRIDDVLETAADPQGTRKLASMRGEVRFEQVSFRHGPTTPSLFEELSFSIAPGEKIAIVGRSGQGKSTIMKLLLGVHRPTAGRILLDGVELLELDRQSVAKYVGVVLQEPFLLDDTVEHNLRLRVPDASLEALHEAARIACIHDIIETLPAGYGTRLGGAGVRLSGGQRQRLAVARAIVGEPKLLLLDEATSSLDLETERLLHENLGQLGCTRIVIAHRLATVVDADRILVLDRGRIVQQGSYAQLASVPGLFRELTEALS